MLAILAYDTSLYKLLLSWEAVLGLIIDAFRKIEGPATKKNRVRDLKSFEIFRDLQPDL